MNVAQAEEEYSRGFQEARLASELADALLTQREKLAARAQELGGLQMMAAYSDLTDALIRRIFHLAVEEGEARGVAIAAVGGYGRREMSPFSDVDVAFIVDSEEDEERDLMVKRAFRVLMDTLDAANLKVGYSYRGVDEVQGLPLETQTALLDARCVAGSSSLFQRFGAALREAISPAAFVIGHVESRNSAGAAQDTPFVVEPDVKEGPGGLRDLHAARWIAQIAFRLPPEEVWEGLRSRGIVLDCEMEAIHGAAEFTARARNAVHLIAGRGTDVLAAGKHTSVAERMGFASAKEFISGYFSHAHHLWRIYHKVAGACLRESLEIEPGMVARDGRLQIQDRGLLARDQSALLRIFYHTQSYGLEIDRQSADLIAASTPGWKLVSDARRTFLDILSRRGAAAALRSMADVGVLQVVVPQFGELMYLVPGDTAHKFTVGEHSLRSVEQLEALLSQGGEQFADILSRVQDFEVLFLATLLHDMGKLDSKRDHAKVGAARAAEFAATLGMPQESCEKVEFLVRHHLKMAETARLRDLQRQKTIRDFVAVVSNLQLLDMLLLLTVADYQSVGTTNWSQVQTRFLLELHERAAAALRSPDAGLADLERHRQRVRRELCLANLPPDEVEEHCTSMPASYLLNTPPEELAAHIGYVRTVRNGTPAVEIMDDRGGQFTELTVAAADRPGLLSDIAGVLHAMSIDIHAAQIHTRHSTDDIAVDVLYIDFEGRQLGETKKSHLEGELLNVLTGRISVSQLLPRWGKEKLKKLENLSVKALDNLSDHETVLEIRADDRPGLLHYLTRKISELGGNIHSARVATWGHEARDVFYVTNAAGGKLSHEEVAALAAALKE